MTPAAILKKAKKLIETKGWIKRVFRSDKGYCAYGAILMAGPHLAPNDCAKAIDILSDIIGGAISEWNDARGRTKEEVLAAFDRAIELAEKQQ